jgi:1,2-dihydroxy-3-keto-5-methylthiopentene dioxygenase
MAMVHVPDTDQTLEDPKQVAEFLAPFGIEYERWDVDERIGADATDEEILAAFAPEIERLKQAGGYVTADVINITPDTPGLDAMLAKFDKEHFHTEDEVRFTVKGSGLFHIHPEQGPVFSITVTAGDLISVPRETRHWFNLCGERTIRCIRLFEDVSGWTPHYENQGVHAQYAPLCLGPAYLPGRSDGDFKPVVNL